MEEFFVILGFIVLIIVSVYLFIECEKKQKLEEKISEKQTAPIKVIQLTHTKTDVISKKEVYFTFESLSEKIIKYLTFEVTFYNDVNDETCHHLCKVVGPIKKHGIYGAGRKYDLFVPSDNSSRMKVTGLRIEYMDGTVESIYDERLNNTFGSYRVERGSTYLQKTHDNANAWYVVASIGFIIYLFLINA